MKQLTIILLMISTFLLLQLQTQAQSVCAFDELYHKQLKEDPVFRNGVGEANREWSSPGRRFSTPDERVIKAPVTIQCIYP